MQIVATWRIILKLDGRLLKDMVFEDFNSHIPMTWFKTNLKEQSVAEYERCSTIYKALKDRKENLNNRVVNWWGMEYKVEVNTWHNT